VENRLKLHLDLDNFGEPAQKKFGLEITVAASFCFLGNYMVELRLYSKTNFNTGIILVHLLARAPK
jgi:hypothetical protein